MKIAAPTSQEHLRSVLDYDPDSGIFIWRRREIASKGWNGRWAGKQAGHLNNANGYIYIAIDKPRLAHRLAFYWMTDECPEVVDHIDRVRTNNKWGNLRSASYAENLANSWIRSDNTTGFKGISRDSKSGKWMARIVKDDRIIQLGLFATDVEAAASYKTAARLLFGRYADLVVT